MQPFSTSTRSSAICTPTIGTSSEEFETGMAPVPQLFVLTGGSTVAGAFYQKIRRDWGPHLSPGRFPAGRSVALRATPDYQLHQKGTNRYPPTASRLTATSCGLSGRCDRVRLVANRIPLRPRISCAESQRFCQMVIPTSHQDLHRAIELSLVVIFQLADGVASPGQGCEWAVVTRRVSGRKFA